MIVSQGWRYRLLQRGGEAALQPWLQRLQPLSLAALLLTLVLLFGFQGEHILNQPLVIVLLAVPILIQVYFNSVLAYCSTGTWGRPTAWRALGLDRRQQFLRTGGGDGHQPVRF